MKTENVTREPSGSPAQTRTHAGAPSRWEALGHKTLRLRYPVVVLIAVGMVTLGQLIEDLGDSPPLQMLPPNVSIPRWTVIAVVLYMLVMLRVTEQTVQRSLNALRRAAQIDDSAFATFARRMKRLDVRYDLGLIGISALVVIVLLPVLHSPLPTTNDPITLLPHYLPNDTGNALLIVVAYTFVGWAGLSLVANTIRLAHALGQLARMPLKVDIFDTTDLLPFGRIALVIALVPVGVIAILLFGLGQPNGFVSWSVVLLATLASVLALIFPLRGVHHQMTAAKEAAQQGVNRQLAQVYNEMTPAQANDPSILGPLSNRTNTLMNLRKVISEMPTWPFRSTLSFGRALLVASAPLIYTVLSELIKIFLINPLVH